MSALAATLEAYFADRLIGQRHASPHTVAAYRDSWRLLLRFMRDRTGKEPSELDLADLDAPAVGAFLDHLEHERHNSARTRNARLAAIRSFFHYAALRHPEHAGLIARVLAIPAKRCDRTEVCYLTRPELNASGGCPRPDQLDRAARPRPARPGHPDRPSRLGAHRPAQSGHRAGRWRPRPLHGQGQEGTGDASLETERGRSAGLDARAWRRSSRPALPHQAGHLTQPRRCRRPGCQARDHSYPTMPVARHQTPDSPRPSPQLCHGIAGQRGATRRSSLCGSAMRAPRPPAGSTSTPTSRSRNEPSPAQRHYTPSPVATGQGTGSWPSSTACDYAVRTPSNSATLPRSTVPRPIIPARHSGTTPSARNPRARPAAPRPQPPGPPVTAPAGRTPP